VCAGEVGVRAEHIRSGSGRGATEGALLGLFTGALDVAFLIAALAFGGRTEDRFVVDLVRALALYTLVGAGFGTILAAASSLLFAGLERAQRAGLIAGLWVFLAVVAARTVHGTTLLGGPEAVAPNAAFYVATAVLAAAVAVTIRKRAAGPWAASLFRATTVITAIFVAGIVGAVRQSFELPAFVAREIAAIDATRDNAAASSAAPSQRSIEEVAASPRPDLLLLTIDTLRADRIGAYGSDAGLTPGLDRLAGESILFETAIAQSSWTRPSFGSIFTSRYPSDHEATWRRMNDAEGKRTSLYNRPLRPDLPTLAELLDGAGYITVAINTNVQTSMTFGFQRGFDHFIDVSRPLSMLTSSMLCRWPLLRLEAACARISSVAVEYPYLLGDEIERIAAAATARLEAAAAPFFLWVHLMDPHVPYDPHDGSGETVGYAEIERALAEPDGANAARALVEPAYAGAVGFADEQARRIVERVDAAPERARAVVLLTSDHGEEVLERWRPSVERNPGLELYYRGYGHGHTMYEEVLRVPLILRLPDKKHAGSRVRVPVMHVDIAPTLLALAGVTPDASRFTPAGQDLVALVETPDGDTERKIGAGRAIRSEATLYGAEVKQLRQGSDKIIERTADAAKERYDLAEDPRETRDLSSDAPPRFRALVRVLDDWLASLPPEPVAPDSEIDVTRGDVDLGKQLEALGYME
jgi:arylsulfatase A-like enzyme